MAHNITHLDLIVQQHPQNLFFKDKGGKRNQLNFKISLGPHRGLTLLKPIPLKLGLYTEHDSRVEDEDVNKKVLWTHKESYEITPEDDIVDIWFRIEKVSSKLGLFKIYVGPGKGAEDVSSYFTRNNKQPCPPGSVQLNSVYSSLIEVRSKVNELGNRPRPMGSNGDGGVTLDSSTGNILMANLGDLNDQDESALAGAVTQIGEALHHVSSAVTTLEQRISILHKRLAIVEAQLGTTGIPTSSSSSTNSNNIHHSASRSNSNNVNTVHHATNSFTAQLQYGESGSKDNMMRSNTQHDDDDDEDNLDNTNQGNGDTDSETESEAPYEVQTNDFVSASSSSNMTMNNGVGPLLHTPANGTVQLHSMNGALPPTLAAAVAAANTSSTHHHPHLNTPGGPGPTAFMGHVMQPSAVRMSSPNLMGSPNWGMSITGSPPGLNLGANAMGSSSNNNNSHGHHGSTTTATTLSSSSSSSSAHHSNVHHPNTVNNLHSQAHMSTSHGGSTTLQASTTTNGTELPSAVSGGASPTTDPSYVLRSLTVPSTYDALFTAPITNPPIPNLTGLVGHRDSFDYTDPNGNELYGGHSGNDNDAVDGHMFENAMDNDVSNLRTGSGSNRRGGHRKRSIVMEHGGGMDDGSMTGAATKRGRPGRAYSEISIGNAWDGGALGMTGMGVGNSLNTSSNALTPTNVLMTAGLQPFSDSGVQIMVAHNNNAQPVNSGHASTVNSGGGGRSSPSSNITSSSTNSTRNSVPRSATRSNSGRSAVAEAAALDAMNEAAGRHTVVDALAMLGRDVRGNP